jgi:hypothetical protein
MVSRFCEVPAGVQRGLAQLERGGPPRRLGDVLGEVIERFEVAAPAAVDRPPRSETSVHFDVADQRFGDLFADQPVDRFWAVA